MTNTDATAVAAATLGTTAYKLLIGHAWQTAATGATFPVRNPATGTTLAAVPDAGARETRQAIDAAATALPAWSATPAPTRAALLRKVAVDWWSDKNG